MEVTYTPRARQSSAVAPLLEAASKRLEDIVGLSGARVRAEWDRVEDDRGRPLFKLQLSDWTGTVETHITPEELRSERELRYRLHRLWGDLLQVRSHKQLEELMAGRDGE